MEDESNPSSRNKRSRHEAEDEVRSNHFHPLSSFEAEDDDSLTNFSDTLFALRMMRAQFPSSIRKAAVEVEPFVLRSQLYSSLQDRTQVDRDLEMLKQGKQLRIFKLNTGQDDDAIMFMDDYINQIGHAVKKIDLKCDDDIKVFDWFRTHVINSKREPSIGHDELLSLLSIGGEANDDSISLLINAGLLGRKELISLLKRTKYKEMMMATLEKKQLRYSPLDIRFHIRDLIGSGLLKTAQTATGIVVRISKD